MFCSEIWQVHNHSSNLIPNPRVCLASQSSSVWFPRNRVFLPPKIFLCTLWEWYIYLTWQSGLHTLRDTVWWQRGWSMLRCFIAFLHALYSHRKSAHSVFRLECLATTGLPRFLLENWFQRRNRESSCYSCALHAECCRSLVFLCWRKVKNIDHFHSRHWSFLFCGVFWFFKKRKHGAKVESTQVRCFGWAGQAIIGWKCFSNAHTRKISQRFLSSYFWIHQSSFIRAPAGQHLLRIF